MKRMIHALGWSLWLPLFLAGCLQSEKEGRCPENECGPFEYRDSFFPLSVGNSWTFTDDAGLDSGGSVESFTVTIESRDSGTLYATGGPTGIWWEFVLMRPPSSTRNYEWLSPAFWRHNDSVYARQAAMEGGFASALSYLVPPGTDTVKWSSTFGSDVLIEISAVRLQDSVTVPAGTFAPCIAYEYHAGEDHRTVLCDGVGWVSFDVGRRMIRLVEYTIVP